MQRHISALQDHRPQATKNLLLKEVHRPHVQSSIQSHQTSNGPTQDVRGSAERRQY
ncbi:hypothetical protein VFPFJ_03503 [Purpureocillium lilacinum]|uniref:Uncharacterized protein n=1 Tax=Purpureocillium lilacinum TaxID=33203 RepID=A0A179GUT8_PURLI|nr:hypothetical protein VFPFJ_03503 [Purpureocillium lilacinum]OAQ81717.1 hypothetical protein VFPBJ_04301 [Purpureocillium lilacinum]OAQ91763.1 hypothetical protein VFPFJ_03503 [Purpureocillium lilacinum]